MNPFLITIFLINLFPFLILLIYLFYFIFKRTKQTYYHSSITQPVSIIICTYNDAMFLKDRIRHFLHPKNWINGSEIIICNDGSTDETEYILSKFGKDPRIRIITNLSNQGKIRSLNKIVPLAKNELLVFSDVRQKIKPGSIKSMCAKFIDTNVGIVTCKVEDDLHGRGVSIQRKISNKIAAVNSENGFSLSLFGALYMQRKKYFQPIPEEVLFDDFYALCASLSSNFRIIQDPYAAFYDVCFQKYYYRERIERLTRGMLIQLTIENNPINDIPLGIRLQLYINKYLKFLLPFNAVFVLISVILYHLINGYFFTLILLLVLLSFLFVIPITRRKLISMCKIGFYFIMTTLKFILKENRSNRWQKLIIHD